MDGSSLNSNRVAGGNGKAVLGNGKAVFGNGQAVHGDDGPQVDTVDEVRTDVPDHEDAHENGSRVGTKPGARYAEGKSRRDPDRPTPGAGPMTSPAPVSDEQLLSEYCAGDKASFGSLVHRYQRELYHFLVRFLGNRAAAEDVFQETFLQVHQSAEAFDQQRRFKPWLFTIAANKARDLIRSQARRPTNPLQASIGGGDDEGGEFIDLMEAAVELPEEPLARQEMQQKVQRVVAGMPDHLREILILSYFNTFPYRQIADILEIPLGTVKSRLHAAVATFAERWKAANRSQNGA